MGRRGAKNEYTGGDGGGETVRCRSSRICPSLLSFFKLSHETRSLIFESDIYICNTCRVHSLSHFPAAAMPAQHEPESPRRLPSVPRMRHLSRPLPPIPRPLSCRQCHTCITSSNAVFPPSDIPSESRSFRGFSGKASLFTETYNVKLAPATVQLMATGAHSLSEITCSNCTAYLGYKIVRAFEKSERWKESAFLLELAELENPCLTLGMRRESTDSSEDSS
ncbi:hypothetical protein DFH07DRAFT_269308 [Mycena maculata]|uniref:Yippee domain-containing protein n=1 Tax=Mycena maculata TaxID=230809 RepID=A0AAD7JTZ3_9AGAR|nr:hypothetical protein DFH07DRAFT_269308 [Mycena maculata]